MQKHADIVELAGSPTEVADWRNVSIHTVRSWIQRNSIPAEHWLAFVQAGHATLEQLSNPDARGREDKAA